MNEIIKNKEVTSYDSLVQSMSDIMVLYNKSDGCTFHDAVWRFNSKSVTGEFELDFGIFELPEFNGGRMHKVFCHGGEIEVTNQELIKILFLEHIEKSESIYYYHRHGLSFIAKLCAFLNSYDIEKIEDEDLLDFYSFIFSHKIQANKIVNSFSPPAFQSLTGSVVSLNNLLQYLNAYHADSLIGNITIDGELEGFNEACQAQLGMNLSEYKNGSSFNYLGLNIGKHYIDHCGSVFEDNIQYAIAARLTLTESIEEIRRELGQGTLESIQPIVTHALLGKKLNELPESMSRIWRQDKLEFIYEITLNNFVRNFNDYAEISCAFDIDTINEIVKSTGLPDRYDAQEFIRSMLFSLLIDENVKSGVSIYKEYFSALTEAKEAPDLSIENFVLISDQIIESRKKLLSGNREEIRKTCIKYIDKVAVESNCEGVRQLKAGLNMVAACGVTLLLGLLGWRRSEFGFSLEDITLKQNETVLDNLYTPLRFIANWTVRKTSGQTKLDREISQSAYLIVFLLDKLNESGQTSPALYYASKARSKGETAPSDSSLYIANLVDYAWPDFIRNYSEKDAILNGNDKELKQEFRKLEEDLPIYTLCQTDNSQSFITKLEQYRHGELSDIEAKILDEKLSTSTKEKLKDFDTEISSIDSANIRLQILQDVAYPTPHAFRHVWAEAVLRRYRGDVGKFIRANFKHLDESFFMAYLRDKETNAVYQVAKRTTINAIVRQQLLSLTNNDREFAGGFDHLLTKAVNSTQVVSYEEYVELSNRISEERVINISPRPWVTCMLRVRTEAFAKCSEDGEPQPQKAEPKFCLGCINANIAAGNFNGIVIYIQSDINACRNESLPAFVRKMHEPIVRNSLKRVRELARNSDKYNDFIQYLEDTLLIADKLNKAA